MEKLNIMVSSFILGCVWVAPVEIAYVTEAIGVGALLILGYTLVSTSTTIKEIIQRAEQDEVEDNQEQH